MRFYHSQLHALAQVTRLRRGQILVDDQQIDVALEGADDELVQLVGRELGLGVDPGPVPRYDVDDVDPRRVGRFAQSRDMDLDVPGAAAGGGRDQDRVLEICDALRAGVVRERGLRGRGSTWIHPWKWKPIRAGACPFVRGMNDNRAPVHP